ncbi:MAG: 3-phosphoshikimate 1-carboxyvinyltransferase [Bacteroidales bacterium]|nr:3-phosphoshikimate 1-carboxyvinyltransferase [Bacteroidales bacterium]MBR4440134.1 3-phosphoshikimate 1-carboxyvinyltransferase [Bacteroidales bacterium]
MNKLIEHSEYNADFTIPSSKSYMQRAVALAILADGKSILRNPDNSNDSLAILNIARKLGCSIHNSNDTVEIKTFNTITETNLSVGEAGLGLRLFTPVCCLFGTNITIGGYGTLLKRPMISMEKPLADLGAKVKTTNGYIPIKIEGKLKGGETEIDGSESSQFLTGLLTALPLAEKDSIIKVKNLKSIPYVEMTLDIIRRFGGEITNHDHKVFEIKGGQKYHGTDYTVEGDWSSAAGHLVAGAIAGRATIYGLNPASLQADKAIINVLMNCGAHIEIDSDKITVAKHQLMPFHFDATDCPDLFPVVASLASQCAGTSIIKGISRLVHKESNRAMSIKEEFEKIGIAITLEDDNMIIEGGQITGGRVNSHQDHRMAMALAIAALNSQTPVQIDDADAVNKSYPKFWGDFEKSLKK